MSKGLKRLVITLASALAVYCWLGFLLIPSVALKVINQQLGVYATTPAHLQRLEFNPLSLELFAWDFQIGEADNKQISLEHLYSKLAFDSIWTKTLHLEDVLLVKSNAEVVFNKQGELNLTQLFNLPESTEQLEEVQETDSTPLAVLIDQIQLQEGSIRFNDQRQQDPVDITIADLNITLNNLDTRPDGNSDLQLKAQASDGAQLQWQGDVSLNPIASHGHLQLQDAKLASWWPYVSEHFTAQLKDGQLNLDTHYELNLTPELQFKAKQLSAQINSLALEQQDQPLARMAQLSVSETEIDLAKQQVQIGNISSSKLEAWTEIDKNGVINWEKLLPSAPAEKIVDNSPADSKDTNEQSAWRIIVKQADLTQHQFHLADNSRGEPVALNVSELNLHIKDFDSQAKTPFNVELDTRIGEQGKFSSNAQVLLEPLNVNMTANSSDIDLRPAQSFISPYAHIELRSGLLNSALKVNVSDPDNLKLTVAGDASITQLDVRDSLRQRDLLKWQSVGINGIQYALQENKLSINKVALQQPYARFIINEDLTTNISELIIEQPASPADKNQTDSPEFAMHIGGTEVKDGSANFADFSLTPNFATVMQQLNGNIGTIDNQTNSVTKIDIKGSIDRYAPVTIKGSLIPFDPLKQLDIATSFKHVELTTLTPYSGKFAGYRIQKGRLNLDLHYKITDGKLNATNKLLLEQLQLGERVDSPDAVDLPVRLAIALLKDRKGEISIDLPVQGDLNNPEFSVTPIIWQTLRNLITRAVSAPFNFIGGLVSGSSEELNEVVFSPGTAAISPAAAKSLNTLAKALNDRPQLRLEVEGASLAKLDGPILAEMRLAAAYQNAWYSVLQHRGGKIQSSKEELEVPEKEKAALLESVYRTALKQQPPVQWKELKKAERTQKMHDAVLATYAQSPASLRRLAQDRANSIKEYLIEEAKLDAERVYLIDVSEGKAASNQGVVSTLHLGSM